MTNRDNQLLEDNVKALDFVNFQIAELIEIKSKLELKIIEGSGHDREGSRTYEIGKHKVTIKTDFIYSLDKDEYQIYKSQIPSEFNPVRESMKYDIDKRVIKKCDDYASREDMILLSKFITKKPAKANIKIGANI